MKPIIIVKLVRQNRIGKTCALVAATLILPALAYANPNGTTQNGTTQNGTTQNGTGQNGTVMPEVNPVWVLVPFLGAVLVLSSLQLTRAKKARKNGF
jgi:hypothetical protein